RSVALDADGGIAPPRTMDLLDTGGPLAADAEAAGDADVAIDDEELPVIPWDEAEPSPKARRAEYRDLDSGVPKALEELARCAARADPVDEEPDGDAANGRAHERLRHLFTDLVRPEDVHLEIHALFRAVDEMDHLGKGRRSVSQEHDGVTA